MSQEAYCYECDGTLAAHNPNCLLFGLVPEKSPATCQHEDFRSLVRVGRLTNELGEVANFCADVRVVCAQCGTPFRFLGVESGYDPAKPTTDAMQLERRAPLAPGIGTPPKTLRYVMPRSEITDGGVQ